MSSIPVCVYGAGGFGREVAWLLTECSDNGQPYQPVAFIDDSEANWGAALNDIPVIGLEEAVARHAGAFVVGGIGAPNVRQQTMERALAAGLQPLTVIHPRVERSRWIEFGAGALICAGNILTTNIVLHKQVQMNLDCTIGHDVILGEYTTLAPGVHVSGCVQTGARVYIGTGAVIINGTHDKPILIGDDAVIGAGACVTKSVEPGVTVVGVPAKPLMR